MTETGRIVRIGGASGFWGDSALGPIQLVRQADLDYLVFDYLAETTMAILADQRRRDPSLGYAADFVDIAMRDVLVQVVRRKIKIVTNAGGLNPRGCADALALLATELDVEVRIAVVEGDDVSAQVHALGVTSFDDPGQHITVPAGLLSANVYLGALPVAQALRAGADVVITGRCVDSAVALGPLMHEFGWGPDDYDRLATGSLAGHIIECGCQATGGLHTDWAQVPDWANIGYPIIECRADGSFDVTKAPSTGGLVSEAGVAEQLLYEIGDPTAYVLPDVICDFSQVRIDACGPDRVRVYGARGRPPTSTYKLSATYVDGYRSQGTMIIIGIDAAAKARRTAESILERTRSMFAQRGLADYAATCVEVIGAETLYGPHARDYNPREVTMRVAVAHSSKQALEIFGREIAPSGTSWAPGTTTPPLRRPSPVPRIMQFNGLVPKSAIAVRIAIDGQEQPVEIPMGQAQSPASDVTRATEQRRGGGDTMQMPAVDGIQVPLIALAYARSGDKGDRSNIGVIARKPEYLPLILSQLTPSAVLTYFAHLARGPVRRYLVPGIHACNFVIDNALAGGGPASLRMDPLGKGMAQMLLDFAISVPAPLAERLNAQPSIPSVHLAATGGTGRDDAVRWHGGP